MQIRWCFHHSKVLVSARKNGAEPGIHQSLETASRPDQLSNFPHLKKENHQRQYDCNDFSSHTEIKQCASEARNSAHTPYARRTHCTHRHCTHRTHRHRTHRAHHHTHVRTTHTQPKLPRCAFSLSAPHHLSLFRFVLNKIKLYV